MLLCTLVSNPTFPLTRGDASRRCAYKKVSWRFGVVPKEVAISGLLLASRDGFCLSAAVFPFSSSVFSSFVFSNLSPKSLKNPTRALLLFCTALLKGLMPLPKTSTNESSNGIDCSASCNNGLCQACSGWLDIIFNIA